MFFKKNIWGRSEISITELFISLVVSSVMEMGKTIDKLYKEIEDGEWNPLKWQDEEKLDEAAEACLKLAATRTNYYMKCRWYEKAEELLRKLGKLEKLAEAYEKEEFEPFIIKAAEIWAELGEKNRAKQLYEKYAQSLEEEAKELAEEKQTSAERYIKKIRDEAKKARKSAKELEGTNQVAE